MIENAHQLVVTQNCARMFKNAIARHDATDRPVDTDPLIWAACRDGMVSQLETFEKEIAEYLQCVSER